jgi:hypothetical protein
MINMRKLSIAIKLESDEQQTKKITHHESVLEISRKPSSDVDIVPFIDHNIPNSVNCERIADGNLHDCGVNEKLDTHTENQTPNKKIDYYKNCTSKYATALLKRFYSVIQNNACSCPRQSR